MIEIEGKQLRGQKIYRLFLEYVTDTKVRLMVSVNGETYEIASYSEKHGKLDECRHSDLPENDFYVDDKGQIRLGL